MIVVVGDALTTTELTEAYARGSGHALPSVPLVLARILLSMNKHTKDLYVFILLLWCLVPKRLSVY